MAKDTFDIGGRRAGHRPSVRAAQTIDADLVVRKALDGLRMMPWFSLPPVGFSSTASRLVGQLAFLYSAAKACSRFRKALQLLEFEQLMKIVETTNSGHFQQKWPELNTLYLSTCKISQKMDS